MVTSHFRDASIRHAYPPDRVAEAIALYQKNAKEVEGLVDTLPDQITLQRGHVLMRSARTPNGFHYQAYRYKKQTKCTIIATYDASPHGMLLHVSISYPARLPTYEEMLALRRAFYPRDQTVVQVFPPEAEHVNLHEYCLHLFQAPEAWQGGLFV